LTSSAGCSIACSGCCATASARVRRGAALYGLCVCADDRTENDTLARIGTACLQQLIENNVAKLDAANWERVVSTFIALFKRTTAHQLFDERMRQPEPAHLNGDVAAPAPAKGAFVPPLPLSPGLADNDEAEHLDGEAAAPAMLTPATPASRPARKQVFRQINVKCVLQLLLIETAHELLQNEAVYATIPPADLLRLMAVVDESYRFAKRFNADKDLRTGLWKVGAWIGALHSSSVRPPMPAQAS
jgi:brefeldin A-inhibited guanine nucleotide-exchange protein